jgi:hypothetical protein
MEHEYSKMNKAKSKMPGCYQSSNDMYQQNEPAEGSPQRSMTGPGVEIKNPVIKKSEFGGMFSE